MERVKKQELELADLRKRMLDIRTSAEEERARSARRSEANTLLKAELLVAQVCVGLMGDGLAVLTGLRARSTSWRRRCGS